MKYALSRIKFNSKTKRYAWTLNSTLPSKLAYTRNFQATCKTDPKSIDERKK